MQILLFYEKYLSYQYTLGIRMFWVYFKYQLSLFLTPTWDEGPYIASKGLLEIKTESTGSGYWKEGKIRECCGYLKIREYFLHMNISCSAVHNSYLRKYWS